MALVTRPRVLLTAAVIGLAGCTQSAGPRSSPDSPGPTAAIPSAPSTTAAPAPASVWVANELGRSLTHLDLVAGRVLATYETSGQPHNISVGDAGNVAVTLPSEGILHLVDPNLGNRTVTLGGQPHDVKAAGSRFIVANEGSATIHILESDGRRVDDITLPAPPHDLAISPDGRTAWVSLDGSSRLAVVDLDRGAVQRLVPTGGSPHDLLFSPAGELWVTDWNGPVSVYSGGGEFRGRVELGPQSHHLAFTADGSQGWITDNSAGRVFVVDTVRRTLLATIDTPGAPHHVAIANGHAAVAVDIGATVVYDIASRAETARVPTGSGPHGVAAAR